MSRPPFGVRAAVEPRSEQGRLRPLDPLMKSAFLHKASRRFGVHADPESAEQCFNDIWACEVHGQDCPALATVEGAGMVHHPESVRLRRHVPLDNL